MPTSLLALSMLGATALAAGDSGLTLNRPAGEISADAAAAAWERIYAVLSHPRCANCHVDERNVPMWSGPSYDAPRPHGMNINAGASRMGVESLLCSTCHITSAGPNSVAHGAPHAGHPWMLAPAAFAWYGKDSVSICAQLRDPARNGGRDGEGLVQHILHDAQAHAFITWGFAPGGGREPAPGSMQAHLDDMLIWTAAGMPCPQATGDQP